MNYKRITVSLPDQTYSSLMAQVSPRGVSDFVAGAIQARVAETVGRKLRKTDPWDDFLALRNVLPKFSYKQIRAAIVKGRM